MESPKKKGDRPSKPKSEKNFMRFYALAFELVVANLILIIGGYYLDDFLSSSPAFILVGSFMAIAFTIWLLLKLTK